MSFLLSCATETKITEIDDEIIVNKPKIEQEITAAFKTWQQAISSGNAQDIACLYQKRAILLPLFDRKLRTSQQERFEYFQNLVKKEKLAVHIDSLSIHCISNTDAVVSGCYAFTYLADGEACKIAARFSITYEKIDGKWMILEHDSTQLPA